MGLAKELRLGNLEARRDWGHAREYVRAMWLMLQEERPDDYVIATGEQHTVREFAEAAFAHVGLDYRDYVKIDPQFMRPAEVETLLGDALKARQMLGWSYDGQFKDLVHEMVEEDLRLVEQR
jgi:GDPmannose 4,6-dehydratase